ncbi:hypothetical protein BC829DRAFT_404772 [Chytridium lagenaria]|nr:hypothetical protein BC829DRAFT_404772 [Chytridium lagenaria]
MIIHPIDPNSDAPLPSSQCIHPPQCIHTHILMYSYTHVLIHSYTRIHSYTHTLFIPSL